MNNEPVAWIVSHNSYTIKEAAEAMSKLFDEPMIPLYTNPVKELTDFEIKGVLALDECWIGEDSSMPNMIAFARAILKKAQEK